MFSVIIPVYNGAKFIEDAIKCVMEQTYTDWELIIVNDGSTDETPKILEKYMDFEKVHIITQENGGVSVARNAGIENAKGEYLAFLDADDFWYNNHLETLNKMALKYPDAGLLGTMPEVEFAGGKITVVSDYLKKREDILYIEDFFEEYNRDKGVKMFALSTTCVLREACTKVGGFPVGCKIGEDLELTLKVVAYYPAVITSTVTGIYKKVNSVATKDVSFDPNWHFFNEVEMLLNDELISDKKKENIKKVMQWFTMRRCRHYIIDGDKKNAWKYFRELGNEPNLRKDKLITFVLLFLPVGMVKLIFRIRWRIKA